MSVSNRNRRRVSLLASSSLVAASLLAGVAGLGGLVVAPGVALAADECGNPSANAGGNDVLTCAGPYVSIDYTATTNGNLTLNLEDGVTVTNGIAITGNAGETLTVRATTNVVGAGDPTVVNPLGYAINVQGQGPAVIVDLRSTDVGVDGLPGPAIGSGRGINATNSAGDTQVRLNEGAVNATAGFGINATSAGGGDTTVYLTNGATVTSTGTAVRAISNGGLVDVVTTGLLISNNEGIFANGTAGVTISAGAINAGGTGISATSTGGAVDVTTTAGGVSGSTGIVTNSGSANPTTITLGDNVTGTAGAGISSTIGDADYTLNATGVAITGTGAQGVLVTSNGDGLITLNVSDVTGDDGIEIDAITGNNTVTVVSDGLITANNGVGVDVDSNGPVSVTVNDVTASGYGVIAVSANGASSVTVNGAVNGGGGVAAQSGGAADATVTLNFGSTVSGSDGFSYGAFAQATGTGNAVINVGGDVTEGGIGGFSAAGGVQVTGAGNVAMTLGFDAVEVVSTTGAITVNLTGDIDSTLADAVDATSTTGAIDIILGGVVTAGDNGVEASSTSGNIAVTLYGTVTAGGDGVNLVTGGAGEASVTVVGSVTGDSDGVSVLTNGSGNASATINAGGSVATTDPLTGYGVYVEAAGSGSAIVINNGAVTEGGIAAFATGTGTAEVSGSGSTFVTGAFAAIDTFSGAGATGINVSGAITSTGGDGINAVTDSGALTVDSTSVISAGEDGIEATSTSGAVTVNSSGGTITATATGITASSSGVVDVNNGAVIVAGTTGIAVSGTGAQTVDTTANVTGAVGIATSATGANTSFVTIGAGATVTGTAGDGVFVSTATGGGFVDNFGAIVATGGDGVQVTSTGAFVQVNNEAGATISATGGAGIVATTTGAGSAALVYNVGGGVSGTSGIVVSSVGGPAFVSSNNVTGTAGDAINVSSQTGLAQVIATGTVTSTGGDGIDVSTSAGGAIDISGSAAIDASNGYGVNAQSQGGGITIVYSGGIGSALDPTALGGISAVQSAGAGTVSVTQSAFVYTSGAGVSAVNSGTSGQALATFSGTMVAGTTGVSAVVNGAGNTDFAAATVSSSSTITAGNVGVSVTNAGSGDAITVIMDNVTIDPDDYGSFTSSALNDATVVVGTGATIVVSNTDADADAVGIFATSGQAADDGVGNESVEITVGTDLSITVDDGAGGDADGASGVWGLATGADGGVGISVANGLNISLTGNGAVGVAGVALGTGDVSITTGTGTIDILGLDNTDGAGNFPGSAGIGALSAGGDVSVTSATTISVNNGALDAAGIYVGTSGAGNAVVGNTGQILSSGTGIGVEAEDGLASVTNSAFIGAVGNGIDIDSAGVGSIQVINTGAITSASASGITLLNDGAGGTVFVSNTATLDVSFDGIQAINQNAAGTGLIQVENSATINANLGGGGGFGIFASQAGTGGVLVSNSGAITGSAAAGIVVSDTAASGGITILNTGAIGSSLDPVAIVGIVGAANSGASINIQSTGGAIWAGDVGIRANSTSTGDVQIFTSGGSINANANAASVGIGANSNGGFVQIANNVAVNSAGTGILAANTTGSVSVGTSGVVTATANDAIRTSTTTGANTVFTVAGGNLVSTSGDGIDASSTTGAIDIDTVGTITAGGAGITATATGAGVITIDTAAASTISATGDGVFASSAGGNVTVTNNATVSGGADGIQTVNSGTGVSTLNVNANVTATGAGASALNAVTTGTGAVNVLVANGRTIQDVNGSAIRTGSGGGAVTVNTGTGSTIVGSGSGANGWVVDLNNAAGGTTTLNVGASSVVRSTDNTITGYDDNAIRGVGGSVVINNAGRINGRVLFSGLTGNVVFNNSSLTSWHTTGASTFSGGADVLNNTGAIFTNAGGAATSFDFGAGADTFTQAGLLVVGEPTLGASTLTITNLEAFNNSGRIVFGSSGTTLAAVSDGAIDDRILASGATFTGSGSSLLAMDAFLGATTQTSCGTLTAADCLSLTGGSTAGSTSILVNDVNPAAFGAFNPTGIVLVDVAGAGSTAATHFSLNSGSDYWRADLNSADGVLDKGLFFYDLTLNGNKQHVLVGLPDSEAFEFTTFGAALTDIWRTTTGTWFERQADLRTQLPSLDDSGSAVWMKISGAAAERDRVQGYDLFGVSYDFDTSYAQDTISLIGGLDFVGGGSGKAWVVGGQIGYVDSDVTFDNSPTVTSFEGMTFGLYGSYISGPWFVDAIVNANSLDYDHQAITLAPAGSNVFSGSADTLGFQVEGGWSMPIGANGFFEPLASLSYVSSDIDAVDVPGATVEFDDVTSLRASLGGRVGLTADHGTFSSKWALVARYWNEFEGENDVNFVSGPGFTLSDDFSGSFGEVGGTVNVFGADDRFSAFLNLGVKFQDDYQSTEGSLGLRWRW